MRLFSRHSITSQAIPHPLIPFFSRSTPLCATDFQYKNWKETKEKLPPHLPQSRQSPELYSYYRVRDEFACGVVRQRESRDVQRERE